MTKHRSAFTIHGTVRDPDDRGGVAGLTVEVLDRNLAVDKRLGKAVTDEHGRFELRYDKRDFATHYLEAKPDLYLQVKNAAGEVVHMTTTPIVHEAAAVRGLEILLHRDIVAAAAVEHPRSFFKQILAINPNYFGGAPASGFPQLAQLVSSTQYEELGCVGLSPKDDTLEAVITIKLPYGYGGGLCETGSQEYVAFFIDYGDGRGFVAAGAPVEVNVHDLMATGKGPLHYAVHRAFAPDHLLDCHDPQIVKLRAILSWNEVPTGWDFHPVWGNVKDVWIQIRPSETFGPLFSILPDPSQLVMVGDLASIKAKAEASLAAVAAQAASGKVEVERAQLLPLLAKNPNYFGSLSKAKTMPELLADLAKIPTLTGLDLAGLLPVLPQLPAAQKYEELTCVGLHPEHDLLEATFVVKQPYGYSGDLCTMGSVEYVAFYVDWGMGGGFEYVGTDQVRVHDIPEAAGKPLHYAAKLGIADIAGRLRECSHENIVTVRAILSWSYAPPPGNPSYNPPWGNVLDRRVQLRPMTGPGATCSIEVVSNIHVGNISQSGFDRGYAFDPGSPLTFNRPFGGIVACHGNVNITGPTHYRFMVSADGGASWDPVRDPRYARHAFLPVVITRVPNADGWFQTSEYTTDLANYSLTPLVHWRTYGKNGRYRLRLELGDGVSPMIGQSFEVDVYLDNENVEFFAFSGSLPTLPMIGVAVRDDAGLPKKCDEFHGSEKIHVFGNFRDDHFASWTVMLAGGNLPVSGVVVAAGSLPSAISGVGPTGVIGAGDGSPGAELVAFDPCTYAQTPVKVRCAYAVTLWVWDRAIVGSVSGYAFTTSSHVRLAHVTFNWDPHAGPNPCPTTP